MKRLILLLCYLLLSYILQAPPLRCLYIFKCEAVNYERLWKAFEEDTEAGVIESWVSEIMFDNNITTIKDRDPAEWKYVLTNRVEVTIRIYDDKINTPDIICTCNIDQSNYKDCPIHGKPMEITIIHTT